MKGHQSSEKLRLFEVLIQSGCLSGHHGREFENFDVLARHLICFGKLSRQIRNKIRENFCTVLSRAASWWCVRWVSTVLRATFDDKGSTEIIGVRLWKLI